MSIPDKLAQREIEEDQLYKDSRFGSVYCRLIFLTSQVAVLKTNENASRKSGDIHRFEARSDFEKMVASGRYSSVDKDEIPDSVEVPPPASSEDAETVEWGEVDGIGDRTETALNDADITTDKDIEKVADEEIIDCYGMSERKLQAIREYINE